MGKFNEYTQKATPADNDTLMIYDATSKSNKLSPFSGIWNWIVGKLTNAVISNLQTNNQTVIGALNELKSNTHLGTLNDNIAEYLSKTNGAATTYFVWGNIGGLYPSWAWGTLLCSNDNTANFIGIANSNKVAAFAHYENETWEKVPVESLSNLTTTNKSSLVGAINELNSNRFKANSYIIHSDGSTKTVSVKWDSVDNHMTSFLLIDNNCVTSAYITGKNTGVTEISKGSEYAPPVLDTSSATLKVTLIPWSTALLICLSPVTIS